MNDEEQIELWRVIAERDALQAENVRLHALCEDNALSLGALAERIKENQLALKRYGIHRHDCSALNGRKCTCGFTDAKLTANSLPKAALSAPAKGE